MSAASILHHQNSHWEMRIRRDKQHSVTQKIKLNSPVVRQMRQTTRKCNAHLPPCPSEMKWLGQSSKISYRVATVSSDFAAMFVNVAQCLE